MSLTGNDIRRVSRRTVEALGECGYKCCLFGSAACHLWGMEDRIPKDIDIVVLTKDDAEVVKAKLAAPDGSRFYLVAGQHPTERYNVLWYALCWTPPIRCKIDIVTPNTRSLYIPNVPRNLINTITEIPVMPFLPLLLLKLQGWDDHHKADEARLRKKIPQDETDVINLLTMAGGDSGNRLRSNRWLPSSFVKLAQGRAKKFVDEFPLTKMSWAYIGFKV
ncbi:hypothetical protein AMATHDRAFT_165893 [Amanita thiersii Skay4041]|uniref:Uncharacterized protein n=1 Tax=Amanita thiersii Skay4041 TaxID=703135 RepID=A0A2A9NB39_9AGAR|nr:hypothetical protein AMATHDRAFT_165893 [Amanita thiersii Skay4041]